MNNAGRQAAPVIFTHGNQAMETTTVNNPNMLTALKVREIIQSAQTNEDGWMSKAEHDRLSAELRKLGINVMTTIAHDDEPATDEPDCTFYEVSIHPFVEQFADPYGNEVDGEWSNASGGEYSDEFGDDLDGYPDTMFRKGWSVTSWARVGDNDEHIMCVDDEEYPDYDTTIARAEELAALYRVDIDHRY